MASRHYVMLETPIIFADAAQSPQVLLTLSGLLNGAGRISAQYDRGVGAHAGWYEWRFYCQLTGTNVIGAAIELYIATSDGATIDGQVGVVDAALPSDKRLNLRPLGSLIVDQTTSNVVMSTSGEIYLPQRYLSVGVWDGTTLPFKTDTAAHRFILTPFAEEAQ